MVNLDCASSVAQPHIRPIICGKAKSRKEFGAKISVSLVDGIAMVDHLGWNTFNESQGLRDPVERYISRYGILPRLFLLTGFTAPERTESICRRRESGLVANHWADR
jgi:transposase, IS5 family